MRLSGLTQVVILLASGLGLTQCGSTQQADPSPHADHALATNGHLVFYLSDSAEVRVPGLRHERGMSLYNGDERIELQSLNDTCYLVPVFDGTLCLDAQGVGEWTDVLRPSNDPYTIDAQWFDTTPNTPALAGWDTEETWRLTFGTDNPWFGDLVLKRFHQGQLRGTIETATGDFRFLHGDGLFNLGGWRDVEADRLAVAARQELDHDRRLDLWRQLQELAYRQQPAALIVHPLAAVLFNRHIEDCLVGPLGLKPNTAWVPPPLQRK